MYELIKIENTTIGSEAVPTVSARELHEFLESKQDFSTWIKKRIKDGRFLENRDFTSLHKKMEREIGATSRIEYYITIEMAKHLGMMERNEKRVRNTRLLYPMRKAAYPQHGTCYLN